MHKKRLSGGWAGLLFALGTGNALAIGNISINGFLTVAGTGGDNEDVAYLNGLVDEDVSFDTQDSRLGLQITAPINERMDLTAQLLARGANNSWRTEADWAFVNYQVNDPLQARAGKMKLSTFLVSDYIEVGYAYPWIRPPVEVYTLNPITTVSGVDLLYRPAVGNWSVLVQPYFGNSHGTGVMTPTVGAAFSIPAGTEVDFEAKNMAGLNVSAGTDAFSFRLGYLRTDVAAGPFDFDGDGIPDFPIDDDAATFASAGFSMDWRNVVIFAEYAERDQDDVAEVAFPDQRAGYVTLGYRIGKFLPHVTYAELDEGRDNDLNLALKQSSGTLGLRYELAGGAALKLEASRIEPEPGNPGLFDGFPAEEDYMTYGLALDVIF